MNKYLRASVSSLAIAGILSGCATIGNKDESGQAAGAANPCNPATAAVIGGVIGGLLGSRDANAGGGAVIGAALAGIACGIYNTVSTKQVKTAQQADTDFKNINGGRLPDLPTVTTYFASMESSQYKRGQTAKIKSVAELVNGTREPIRSVREEVVMLDTEGKPIEGNKKDKPFTATAGGRFENTFEFTFPEQAPQRRYDFMTRLYVNDKMVRTQRMFTQVAADGQSYELLALK
jgi:hypothetical protein